MEEVVSATRDYFTQVGKLAAEQTKTILAAQVSCWQRFAEPTQEFAQSGAVKDVFKTRK